MSITLKTKIEMRLLYSDTVGDIFGEWGVGESPLSELLLPFVLQRPFSYFDEECIGIALYFFEADVDRTLQALESVADNISLGFRELFTKHAYSEDEGKLSLERPANFEKFDRVWHPEYERYSDRIFNRLLSLPLCIYGFRESKNYLKLHFQNRVDLLIKTFTELKPIAECCEVPIRNAIAHGSVSYEPWEIVYRDQNKGALTLGPDEFGEKLDRLVDTTNGFAAAILVFLARQEASGKRIEREKLPFGMFLGALMIKASATDWDVFKTIESTDATGKRQLNVYCRTRTRLRAFHGMSATRTAVECVKLYGQRYDRVVINIDCGVKAPSMVIFQASDIQAGIEQEWDLPKICQAAMETNRCWFDDGPLAKWRYVIRNAVNSLVAESPQIGTICEIRNEREESSATYAWISVDVLGLKKGLLTRADVHEIVRSLVAKYRLRTADVIDLKSGRRSRKFVNRIKMRIHQEDARVRALMSRGWQDPGQIAIAEWASEGWSPLTGQEEYPEEIVENIIVRYNPYGNIAKFDFVTNSQAAE